MVCTDLRGYGDSEKPPGGDDHSGYSFRAMAQDQFEVMAALGFHRFMAAGHDRGARVLHRMCLDHPDKIERAAILDIIPQHHLLNNVTRQWGTFSWHWFFMIQPYDLPERLMGADPDYFIRKKLAEDEPRPELLRRGGARRIHALLPQSGDHPRHVRGLPRDLWRRPRDGHQGFRGRPQDRRCPLLLLWGATGGVGRNHKPPEIWTNYATDIRGAKALPCGHYLSEEAPEETYRELRGFFAAR